VISLCRKQVACKFGASKIRLGLLPTEKRRLVIRIEERGLEPQEIVIAFAGVLALIEAAAAFVRVCL
jgi:hypothetical protein